MRRYLIFGLLGPPLGFVVAMYGLVPLLNGGGFNVDPYKMVLLPLAFFLGLVPALLAAAVDARLEEKQVRWRPLWTAAAGFALSFLPVLAPLAAGRMNLSPILLFFGLVGAVPAFCCSLLSGRTDREW